MYIRIYTQYFFDTLVYNIANWMAFNGSNVSVIPYCDPPGIGITLRSTLQYYIIMSVLIVVRKSIYIYLYIYIYKNLTFIHTYTAGYHIYVINTFLFFFILSNPLGDLPKL